MQIVPAPEVSAPTVVPPSSRGITAVDVRPIDPRLDGRLSLGAPDSSGRNHVSAASGLASAGGAAWIVSDEYGELARFDRLDQPGRLFPGLAPAKRKPDLESLLRIPQGDSGSLLVAFGSGSSKSGTRSAALVQAVDGAGALAGGPVRADLAPLYAALAGRLPKGLNIEGLALRDGEHGGELLLFHRGMIDGDVNTIFTIDAARAIDALRAGRQLDADLLLSQHSVDLGTLGGERLGFADAHMLDDGRIAFIASAEGADEHGDGPIKGSAIGIMDPSFAVTALRPLSGPPRKVEGIEPTRNLDPAAPASSFTLVTDPDDPALAAELLTVDLA